MSDKLSKDLDATKHPSHKIHASASTQKKQDALAKALRDNLQKRKQQQRARSQNTD